MPPSDGPLALPPRLTSGDCRSSVLAVARRRHLGGSWLRGDRRSNRWTDAGAAHDPDRPTPATRAAGRPKRTASSPRSGQTAESSVRMTAHSFIGHPRLAQNRSACSLAARTSTRSRGSLTIGLSRTCTAKIDPPTRSASEPKPRVHSSPAAATPSIPPSAERGERIDRLFRARAWCSSACSFAAAAGTGFGDHLAGLDHDVAGRAAQLDGD